MSVLDRAIVENSLELLKSFFRPTLLIVYTNVRNRPKQLTKAAFKRSDFLIRLSEGKKIW